MEIRPSLPADGNPQSNYRLAYPLIKLEATQIIVIGNETIEKGYGPEKESTGDEDLIMLSIRGSKTY